MPKFLDKNGLSTLSRSLISKIPTKVSQLTNDMGFMGNVSAEFLTANGFGGLRYYQGLFQYYNSDQSQWLEIPNMPENVVVSGLVPQPMRSIIISYDKYLDKIKLRWQEPADTVISNQVVCIVEKVIIRRKMGSVPEDIEDGDLAIEIPRKLFNKNVSSWWIDQNLNPEKGNTYYYKAFPVSTMGLINNMENNEDSILIRDYELYGFTLNQNESNPASMITYIEDNKYFNRAYMDFTKDEFNYGDWKHAWFIEKLRPVMLNYDGTEAYDLDPNDLTKKLDGTDSDITNVGFPANAMMAIPKIYWKVVSISSGIYNLYFSNFKVDKDYYCWSHLDQNGNEIDYCYMPIYNSSVYNNRFRSLSGQTVSGNKSVSEEINLAMGNNLTDDVIWYTEVYSDRQLINMLLLLIGKSTDTQSVYGTGFMNNSNTQSGLCIPGTMDKKGLFWGINNVNQGVKVFGIEHYWGNQGRRLAGIVVDSIYKVKMTWGTSDGSKAVDYATSPYSNYISVSNSIHSSYYSGFIRSVHTSRYGLLPYSSSGGSATTYYPDVFNIYRKTQDSRIWAGYNTFNESNMKSVGAFYLYQDYGSETLGKYYYVGANLSCKPLASIQEEESDES